MATTFRKILQIHTKSQVWREFGSLFDQIHAVLDIRLFWRMNIKTNFDHIVGFNEMVGDKYSKNVK
jgi:hypothetical protein